MRKIICDSPLGLFFSVFAHRHTIFFSEQLGSPTDVVESAFI